MIDVSKLNKTIKMKDINLNMLIADAVERKNPEALDFLEQASNEVVIRTTKKGEKIECLRSISSYRAEYLKKYCGYKTYSSQGLTAEEKQRMKERAKAKKAEAKASMFAKARALMNNTEAAE